MLISSLFLAAFCLSGVKFDRAKRGFVDTIAYLMSSGVICAENKEEISSNTLTWNHHTTNYIFFLFFQPYFDFS